MVGTATGLQTLKNDDSVVESVSVRTEDGVQIIPASFVVGESQYPVRSPQSPLREAQTVRVKSTQVSSGFNV